MNSNVSMQWFWDRYAIKAVKVQGGGEISRRMSVSDGGTGDEEDMLYLGEEDRDEKTSLGGREAVKSISISQNSSKADEGRGESSWGLGVK